MSKQQYEVKLLGHAGERRRRAGLEFDRGVATVVELNAEQLAALEADSYFSVTPVGEVANEDETPQLSSLKRAQLDEMAVALGLNPKDYKNIETLVPAIEEAEAAKAKAPEGSEGNDDDNTEEEDEPVVLSELTDEELLIIAEELKVEVPTEGTPEEQRAALIAGIEAAQPKTEE